MTINWTGSSIPEQPLLEIDWGDGDVEKELSFDIQGTGFSKLFKKEFLTHGLMNTAITMYNQVSSVTKTVKVRFVCFAFLADRFEINVPVGFALNTHNYLISWLLNRDDRGTTVREIVATKIILISLFVL